MSLSLPSLHCFTFLCFIDDCARGWPLNGPSLVSKSFLHFPIGSSHRGANKYLCYHCRLRSDTTLDPLLLCNFYHHNTDTDAGAKRLAFWYNWSLIKYSLWNTALNSCQQGCMECWTCYVVNTKVWIYHPAPTSNNYLTRRKISKKRERGLHPQRRQKSTSAAATHIVF